LNPFEILLWGSLAMTAMGTSLLFIRKTEVLGFRLLQVGTAGLVGFCLMATALVLAVVALG